MNEHERAKLVALALGVTVIAGKSTLDCVRVARIENKKRRQIKRWERENLACIKNMEKRLQDIMKDPTKTSRDFLRAFAEENAFVDIVRNQPMY